MVVTKFLSSQIAHTQISRVRLHRTGSERVNDGGEYNESLQRGVDAWRRHRHRAPLTDQLPRLYALIKRKSYAAVVTSISYYSTDVDLRVPAFEQNV